LPGACHQKRKQIMTEKESVRREWQSRLAAGKAEAGWGRAAELLRRQPAYRDAATVFAAPGKALRQARINCLADGKNLVMPAPSLREGFYLLPSRTTSFRDIAAAVTYKGLPRYGRLLKNEAIGDLSVGLLLTDATAVDAEGGRLGDGRGFFDLCCALLHALAGLAESPVALAFILEEQVSGKLLPQDKWDIKMTGAVTPVQTHKFGSRLQPAPVYWDHLTRAQIKRIDPLWKIHTARDRS
jgi:5-formyltetrahydrofolate cyclo-ligase